MKNLILLTISLLICSSVFATGKVFVYRDADGTLVFSDTPKSADTEEVKINVGPTVVPSEDTSILSQSAPSSQPEAITYQIQLNQPSPEATIRDNTGSVYVSGGITPNFPPGFKVRLLLDGKPYQQPISRATYIMRNIDRGEHTVQMQLLDRSGKVIASSQTTKFYLHRNSVAGG